MEGPPRRRFGTRDAMVLLAATALGLVGLQHSWMYRRLQLGSDPHTILRAIRAEAARFLEPAPWGWPVNLAHFVTLPSPLIASWSVGALVLWAWPRRDGTRRAPAEAGVAAHLAATIGMAGWGSYLISTPGAGGRYVPATPRGWFLSIPFASMLTVAAGASVALAWSALVLSRRWRGGRDWVARSGRVFGAWWIVATLVTLASSKYRETLVRSLEFARGVRSGW